MSADSRSEKLISDILELDKTVLSMIYRGRRLKEAVEKEMAKKLISKK